MVVGFEPCFRVADVARSRAHYEQLGFTTSDHDETYAFAHLDDDLTIHLTRADPPLLPGGSVLYLHVDDADDVTARWREAGMTVEGPANYDYGKREGVHVDPDGNTLRFG